MSEPEMPSYLGHEVDVVIVGSGAGGGPMALRLAEAGASVVVLEKGRWMKREDFRHDEIEFCRRNAWAPFPSDEPHLLKTERDPRPRESPEGWTANVVGGGTVHMSGFFFRLHPEDFRMKSTYVDGSDSNRHLEGTTLADWPIGYEDLAPFYDEVERVVGVSGRAGAHPFEPPRSGPYLLPPVSENPMAALIDRGAEELGWHTFPTPRAVLSRPHNGRNSCFYSDFCGSYGCESGAKGSSLDALLPGALATGRCEIRPRSMAAEIVTNGRGRPTGVRYIDAEGNPQEQRARFVVVSATAVESARLLLNSKSTHHPRGLANGSGQVGKNLTFSTLGKGYGEFRRAELPAEMQPHNRVHFLQRALQDFYRLPDKPGYDKGGTIHFILPHQNPIYTAERVSRRTDGPPLWGRRLQEELKRYYDEVREVEFEIFGEFLPTEGTSVEVVDSKRDRFGLPVAQINLQHHPEDVATGRELVLRARELLSAAGAHAVRTEVAGGTTFVLQHGTCRFGRDADTSVLDVNCQAHEVDNLYVVDGSFMPTSGGVPTTWTIMANAFRVARHLVERLGLRIPDDALGQPQATPADQSSSMTSTVSR